MLRCRNLRNPYRMFYLSYETAGDNPEEGEDDAKSAWPLTARAAHVIQWLLQWDAMPQGGANLIKTQSQFGWGLATRPHEAGSLT